MAEVEVDTETGIVKVKEDGRSAGLRPHHRPEDGGEQLLWRAHGDGHQLCAVRRKSHGPGHRPHAESQHGVLPAGGPTNDIPELVVHMMTGKGYDERGVIGLGEPPVISPGAAISNAVANAIGVRVPFLPLTPDRVLDGARSEGRCMMRPFEYASPTTRDQAIGLLAPAWGQRRSPRRRHRSAGADEG